MSPENVGVFRTQLRVTAAPGALVKPGAGVEGGA